MPENKTNVFACLPVFIYAVIIIVYVIKDKTITQ